MANILPRRSRELNGLAIIRWAWSASCGLGGNGAASTPPLILRSADASASGSPDSSAPDSSAWYSRDRETASRITVAAIGPSSETRIRARPLGPPPFRFPPPKAPANIAMLANPVITEASAPATHEMRMSRL